MFRADVRTASEMPGIALTSGERSKKNPVPLRGVPFHSAEPRISKLLASGKKVAVREQTGDPKQTKGGIVERKVVRVPHPAWWRRRISEARGRCREACIAREMILPRLRLGLCQLAAAQIKQLA